MKEGIEQETILSKCFWPSYGWVRDNPGRAIVARAIRSLFCVIVVFGLVFGSYLLVKCNLSHAGVLNVLGKTWNWITATALRAGISVPACTALCTALFFTVFKLQTLRESQRPSWVVNMDSGYNDEDYDIPLADPGATKY